MPLNTSGLRRGGPGRPKGSKNKGTAAMIAVWQEFLGSDRYLGNARKRVIAGKAPHLEVYWHNKLIGKPVERIEHSGPEGGPIQVHDHFAVPPGGEK